MMDRFTAFVKNLFLKEKSFYPYLAIVAIASIGTLYWELKDTQPQDSSSEKTIPKTINKTIDTYIPYGYVLVPLEIANHDALHSLLGKHGIVDLFLAGKNGKPPRRIARQIKLLRAPHNPHKFAALVPEAKSARFVLVDQPLFAVIKNPLQNSAIKQVENRARQRKIYFGDQLSESESE